MKLSGDLGNEKFKDGPMKNIDGIAGGTTIRQSRPGEGKRWRSFLPWWPPMLPRIGYFPSFTMTSVPSNSPFIPYPGINPMVLVDTV